MNYLTTQSKNVLYPSNGTNLAITPTETPMGSPKKELQFNLSSYKQVHENDPAAIVILNEPSLCQWMGSIHPNGSLYEEPLDISKAQKEHLKFKRLLEAEGCQVFTVKEILTGSFDHKKVNDISHRVQLEDFAFDSVNYVLDDSQSKDELGEIDNKLLSDQYKKACLDSMSNEQLVDVILTRPTIKLRKSERDTELLATEYSFKPLVNLVFQRDQQITTANGIVMANLSSPIRAPEVEVMKLCFRLLDLPVIGQIPNPGKLEGGDFYPCGQDLCFIGVGLRSNFYACQYLMDNDLLGTNRLAVVKDYFDMNQQRMHLDTVCNIINESVMLILEDICGEQSETKRLVDEYTKNPNTNKYELTRHDVEFSKYLNEQGFQLIKVTNQNQADYGCNGLNIGNGKFIVVDKATAKTIARSSKSRSQLLFVDFRTVTKMYGSVHCCSQVVSRRPRNDTFTVSENGSISTFSSKDFAGMTKSNSNSNISGFNQGMTKSNSNSNISGFNHGMTKSNSYSNISGFNNLNISHDSENDRVLMVAPTYFVKARAGSELANASVIRKTRQLVLQDYSKLHKIMAEHGVNIHLFSHEPYHKTDQAVYVSEWFSTHSKEELNSTKDTLVLYPLENKDKRRERRDDILTYAFAYRYKRVLDFTSCESGDIKVNETTVEEYLATRRINNENSDVKGSYLDFSGIVLDRKNKIAYISIDEIRYCSNVAKLWSEKLGYKLISMKSLHTADKFLHIGRDYIIYCPDAIEIQEDSENVLEYLKDSGRSIIIISKEQMNQNIAEVIEVNSRSKSRKSTIIISEKYYGLYTPDQIKQLESCVEKIIRTDISNLESHGANNMIGMIGKLY